MKYKVGDKVKVRQDLVDGKMYGVCPWNALMECKYIMINAVWADCYVAQNNGANWYYTDEMLDGLVEEPEENPKEPTDAELIQAAELLKANCKNQKDCHKCIFMSNVCCKFEYKTPEEWKLLHRKTRKEVLLEKFPNADTESIIDIMCPRSFGISDRGVTCPSDYDDFDCEACWNAPAESEEE